MSGENNPLTKKSCSLVENRNNAFPIPLQRLLSTRDDGESMTGIWWQPAVAFYEPPSSFHLARNRKIQCTLRKRNWKFDYTSIGYKDAFHSWNGKFHCFLWLHRISSVFSFSFFFFFVVDEYSKGASLFLVSRGIDCFFFFLRWLFVLLEGNYWYENNIFIELVQCSNLIFISSASN